MSRTIGVVAGLVVAFAVLSVALFVRVKPMDIGVRQALLGGGGLTKHDFTTGTYWGITGVHRWNFLPRRTHFLHFCESKPVSGGDVIGSLTERGAETTRFYPPMELRTKDNNQTTIDVTVPFRIKEGEAWMIVDLGLRSSYYERVKSTVENVLRAQLSQLSSEDLQDTDKRLKRTAEVLPMLNDELAGFHVVAESLLIRRVAFPPDYEAKLQAKQLLTQQALLDGALALQAEQEQVTNSIEQQIGAAIKAKSAQWDKKLQELESEYEVTIAGIRAETMTYESRVKAEGDAEKVSLEAEGQLAIDRAQALRDQLRNEILNTRGGRIWLALEAAGNLNVPKVTLNSNDPRVPLVIDLAELAGLLVGSPAVGGAPAADGGGDG
ncbi:MAG: hypothetical protein H6825_02530 [Planctomycetes bacterium]|nr:hypothetical protein [Planctomycetota bacterium]